jgi:hypothetical protein
VARRVGSDPRDRTTDHTARLVLEYLGRVFARGGGWNPRGAAITRSMIARELGITEKTAGLVLHALERHGLIRQVYRSRFIGVGNLKHRIATWLVPVLGRSFAVIGSRYRTDSKSPYQGGGKPARSPDLCVIPPAPPDPEDRESSDSGDIPSEIAYHAGKLAEMRAIVFGTER